MNATDRVPFSQLLTDVLAFYRQDVSLFTLSVWWEAAQPFDLEQVRKALTQHAMDPDHGQFAPKPADLVRVLQGTKTDRSLLAWSAVYGAMSAVGMYQTPDFGDNAIHAAINDMGGWPKVCQLKLDELPFTQKRFCDLYRAYTAAGRTHETVRLLGMSDQENGAKGVDWGSGPVRIGVAAKALEAIGK